MVVLSISNHKGGVGKTSSVLNIGHFLSKTHRVLLIDLDSQANLTFSLTGGELAEGKTIYDALKGQTERLPLYEYHTIEYDEAGANIKVPFHYVPSCLDLSGAELELSTQAGAQCILRELIEKEKGNFDIVLIDCPPSLSLLTVNAFTASDFILIPTQAEAYAVQGLSKLLEVVSLIQRRLNSKLKEPLFLITQYDKRKVLHRQVTEALRERFGNRVFSETIRSNISIAEAQAKGETLSEYAPKSKGAEDYEKLTEELKKHIGV
jgi:chromosome partitioning protein